MSDFETQTASSLTGRMIGCLWGDSKTGKTTWACSLPGRKLLINFDPEGFASVAYRDDLDIIDLSIYPVHEAMDQADKVGGWILENADKYDSIIVDSLTTLTEIALHDAVAKGVGKSQKFIPTLDAPGLSAYGGRNNRVNNVVSRILRATGQKRKHCMFIAHSDDPEYDQEGKNIVQQTIMLGAKIRQNTSLKVSEIYHLAINGKERTVYLAPFGVKKPMGSRIFDTNTFDRFVLRYNPTEPDTEQQCSLQSIVKAWQENNFHKLTALPKL